MITFSKYFQLIEEDTQSFINQAKKILASNGYSEEFVKHITNIIDSVEVGIPPQQKRFNADSNIPILAYMLICNAENGRPLSVLSSDYKAYVESPSATRQNILVNAFNELRGTIQKNKWFKPSDDKKIYIFEWGNKLVEKIHELQVVDTNQKQLKLTDTDDVVYDDNLITVYRADSKAKCIKYGSGSTLCISTKGGGNYYWSYRMGNMHHEGLGMTTYFVYWKDGSNRILIDALGDEDGPANKYSWNPIKPNTDRDVTAMGLIKQYPELEEPFLKDVFQFIPYGDREVRYKWIEENVSYITDTRLKTLEDYEMFVEGYDKDEYDSPFIGIDAWDTLEEMVGVKFGKDFVSYLVKKFAGLGNFIDKKTIDKYLTPKDGDWYLDILIKDFDEDENFMYYFEALNFKNVPHRLIEEYFDKLILGDDEIVAVEEFVNGFIRGKSDIHTNDVVNRLLTYSLRTNKKLSDLFLGRNITPEFINYVFLNFDVQKENDLPNILLAIIRYYKKNDIVVPKILFRCIANDPYLSAKYLYKWYINSLNMKKIVGRPSDRLLRKVASKKSTAYYLLNSLKYYMSNGEIKLGVDIPTYLVDVLDNDPYYKEFVDLIEMTTFYHPNNNK